MKKKLVGVISDTHGLLRPEVAETFAGMDMILHAGDIGTQQVLEGLKSIAPLIAVRGNNDREAWARKISEMETVQIARVKIYMLHDLKEMELEPAVEKIQVVISGHSHRPSIERRDGVLFMNPGSAGPRRFRLPITVARLAIDASTVNGEIIELIKC